MTINLRPCCYQSDVASTSSRRFRRQSWNLSVAFPFVFSCIPRGKVDPVGIVLLMSDAYRSASCHLRDVWQTPMWNSCVADYDAFCWMYEIDDYSMDNASRPTDSEVSCSVSSRISRYVSCPLR